MLQDLIAIIMDVEPALSARGGISVSKEPRPSRCAQPEPMPLLDLDLALHAQTEFAVLIMPQSVLLFALWVRIDLIQIPKSA